MNRYYFFSIIENICLDAERTDQLKLNRVIIIRHTIVKEASWFFERQIFINIFLQISPL